MWCRSAKQCRNRYEATLIPREEGRILYDMNPRKQKKTKGIYKVYNVSFSELLLVRIFAMHSLVTKIGHFIIDITLNIY